MWVSVNWVRWIGVCFFWFCRQVEEDLCFAKWLMVPPNFWYQILLLWCVAVMMLDSFQNDIDKSESIVGSNSYIPLSVYINHQELMMSVASYSFAANCHCYSWWKMMAFWHFVWATHCTVKTACNCHVMFKFVVVWDFSAIFIYLCICHWIQGWVVEI